MHAEGTNQEARTSVSLTQTTTYCKETVALFRAKQMCSRNGNICNILLKAKNTYTCIQREFAFTSTPE